MTRWKASFIHLLISMIIVGTVAAYIIYFWYPPALIHMAKADKLLLLLGGIDLVIGPLLTLIVYKQGKPSLRMDLTVIGVLQAAFLSVGLYTMYQSRPVFLVASEKRFDLVFASEIFPERLAQAKIPRYQTLSITKPQLVGAKLPTNVKDLNAVIDSALSGNGDLPTMPQYYVEYQDVIPDIIAHSQPLQASNKVPETAVMVMIDAAKGYGRNPTELRFMRLGSSRDFAIMLVDAKTGEVVGPVNVDF